jgi:hypothetical protein
VTLIPLRKTPDGIPLIPAGADKFPGCRARFSELSGKLIGTPKSALLLLFFLRNSTKPGLVSAISRVFLQEPTRAARGLMHIRDYEDVDRLTLERIHADTGYDYKFQNLENPLVLTKKVVVDDNGNVIGICYTKLQAETFLTLDPILTSGQKVSAITALDAEVSGESWEKGLDEQVCYLPPGVEEHFSKRLKQCGWLPGRPEWKLWTKDLTT